MKTPAGAAYGGVSRTLGAEVLELTKNIPYDRIRNRNDLLAKLEDPVSHAGDFQSFEHFRNLASDILVSNAVKDAYNLDNEDPRIRESYGDHIGGQSMLLARRLTEAGVPVVQVCCAAGDLNGGQGDMWDSHANNFNRLKDNLPRLRSRCLCVAHRP